MELFLDPKLRLGLLKFGWCLLKEKLGLRTLWEFIPLDAAQMRGSHGVPTSPEDGPVFITGEASLLPNETIHATEVHDLILDHLNLARVKAKPVSA